MMERSFASRLRLLPALAACVFTGLSGALVQAADKPVGAQGVIAGPAAKFCVKTYGQRVTAVCGNYEVSYRVTTLMGDALGAYNLRWTLTSLRMKAPKGIGSAGEAEVLPANLPPALAAAAKKISVSLGVVSQVNSSAAQGTGSAYLFLDTGASVRADGSKSLNVPSGYSWDRFMHVGQRSNDPKANGCDLGQRRYLGAADAKAIVMAGFTLDSWSQFVCPSSTADVDALEAAADRYCRDARGFDTKVYCDKSVSPKKPQPESAPGARGPKETRNAGLNPLDSVAEQVARSARGGNPLDNLAELPKRKAAAESVCSTRMNSIEACFAKAKCDAAGPSQSQCDAIPKKRSWQACMSVWSGCLGCSAAAERERRERVCGPEGSMDAEEREWETRYSALAKQCAGGRDTGGQAQACRKSHEQQCNPRGMTQATCVQAYLAGESVDGEARTATRSPASVLPKPAVTKSARPNFLE